MPTNGRDEGDSQLARAQADLVLAREDLAVSLGALERKVTDAFDWREWVRRRPVTTLTLAFGLGFFVGRKH